MAASTTRRRAVDVRAALPILVRAATFMSSALTAKVWPRASMAPRAISGRKALTARSRFLEKHVTLGGVFGGLQALAVQFECQGEHEGRLFRGILPFIKILERC